ncbi:MAG: hypothetical protein AAFU03_11660, partial [Bacteroidota bacterium]
MRFITLLLLFTILLGCQSTEESNSIYFVSQSAQEDARRTQLPNGWALSPVGRSLPLGDLPLNMVVSANGNRMAVTNNGQSTHSLQWIDIENEIILDTKEIAAGWLGLAINKAGDQLYASCGEKNMVKVYSIENDQLSLRDSMVIGQAWPTDTISAAGIALNEQQNKLYVVTKRDSSLYTFDLSTKELIHRLDLGAS